MHFKRFFSLVKNTARFASFCVSYFSMLRTIRREEKRLEKSEHSETQRWKICYREKAYWQCRGYNRGNGRWIASNGSKSRRSPMKTAWWLRPIYYV